MRYLLDSDIVNYLVKGIPGVTERFREAAAQNSRFVGCPVVHLEVTRYLKLRGATRMLRFYTSMSARWKQRQYTAADWDLAADLWAQRHRAGQPIEDSDLLIAVYALQSGAVLVTNNLDHFEGPGLTIESWAEA